MPDLHDCYTSQTGHLFHDIRGEGFLDGMATGVYQTLYGDQVTVIDGFGPPGQACLARLRERRAAIAEMAGVVHQSSLTALAAHDAEPVPQQRDAGDLVVMARHHASVPTPEARAMRAFSLCVPSVNISSRLHRAVGYFRYGEGTRRDQVGMLARTAIGAIVRDEGLFLTGVYVDHSLGSIDERPALSSLLSVIDWLDVRALIIPSSWHLSQSRSEVDDIRTKIGYSGCELLIGIGA